MGLRLRTVLVAVLAVFGLAFTVSALGSGRVLGWLAFPAFLIAFVVVGGILPFALGVVLQLALRDRELPWYVVGVGTALMVILSWVMGQGLSLRTAESALWLAANSALFAAWFISAGSAFVGYLRKRRGSKARAASR